MKAQGNQTTNRAVDRIQKQLTEYACKLTYEALSPAAIHAAKIRVIDTLGALIGGFFAEPSQIVRELAASMPMPDGATVIGTRLKTTPDMAAYANATTARYVEMTDFYHWPGSAEGHPSDTVTPLLAAAEHARASGCELITGVVLGYEVYQRTSDNFRNPGFDHTNFACLGVATAAGKLLGLTPHQMSHCISMAAVANNTLRQARTGHLSMFKAAASGQAGRAGVFAALLARAGMEGPHLPFEGKAGWCDHVAKSRYALDKLGGGSEPYKILHSEIKQRPSVGNTISSILAAEKIAPVNIKNIKHITIELYKRAVDRVGSGDHPWNPESRETADHSAPYVVAATLMDGTVTPRSFNDAHLWNPDLRALLKKIEVVENPEFTAAYAKVPPEHRTRVTAVSNDGQQLVGESGGERELSAREKDARIEDKFRGLTEDVLGARRVGGILDKLWHLEDLANTEDIPRAFVLG